ncbi:MAG: phosphomannomutase/phosphoglucomutase [Myxococcota bacterium]
MTYAILLQADAGSDFVQGSIQGKISQKDVVTPYLDEMATNLHKGHKPLRVVIDAGNATAGITAVPLYERLGYEVIPLYCELDATFPNHHADPTVEENLADLKKAVAEHQADLGIAFDGDADRLGVVDKHGQVIWGDKLMIIYARELLKVEPGATIIGEVKCSKTMYDAIRASGGNAIMGRTGHSLIKAKMKECGALLAGEMSGHIFFKHRFYGFDDAVYAGGRLLEILSGSGQTLDAMLSDVPKTFSTPEIRLECPETMKFELVDRVRAAFAEQSVVEGFRVLDIDGVRAEWDDGWGLVRASNTGPILVLRFEATSSERLAGIKGRFEQTIAQQRRELSA